MSLKYRLSNIGWYNFELLVQTLLKVVIGPGVTSFGGSKDRGRDAAFTGEAAFPAKECYWTGHWVFQVKYVDFEEQGVDAARASLKSTLASELRQVLSRNPDTDNYVLLTDVPLTAETRSQLGEVVTKRGFKGNFATVDGKEICQLLDIHSDIRKSYPQLLGLADLDVIVNRDLYVRSQAYLQNWQPKLATYVQTEAHAKALSLLKRKHFIVLDGAPEAGKSTIAAALALIHTADGFEIIDVRSSNDIFRSPNETSAKRGKPQKRTLFVADDAIGSISLVAARADEWSRDLPGILRQLNSNRLLVWTARRYILEEALASSRLREAAAEFPRPNEVLVEVGKLSTMQKAEMLYNHAKQANLRPDQRELIRENAIVIINHSNFSPLRVHDLTSLVMKSSEGLTWEHVRDFLNDPGHRWIQAFGALSRSEQTLLSAMLDFEGAASERDLRTNYEMRASKRDEGHLSFEECVARLDHSFLTGTSSHSGQRQISVQHPSLRDMLLLHLRGDTDARRRYISLASAFGLSGMIGGIAQTAESETPPQHAVVPVTPEEFEIFLKRLSGVSQSVLSLPEWDLLLTACERLIPQQADKPAKHAVMSEFWDVFGELLSAQRVEPAELDLDAFGLTAKGKIIRAVVQGFSSKRTLENSQRFTSEQWLRLLKHFYYLTDYLSPPLYPSYSAALCRNLSSSAESIRLANLINANEPLVAKQTITRDLKSEWKRQLDEDADELKLQADDFGAYSDPNQFDEWHSACEELLATVENFTLWSTEELVTTADELRRVLDSAKGPPEPDLDGENEQELPESGPYWTIARLFEDL